MSKKKKSSSKKQRKSSKRKPAKKYKVLSLKAAGAYPFNWVAGLFPGLDFRSTFITISGCILLILYLYHGKPFHFFKYFPDLARNLGREKAAMASYIYSHLVSAVVLLIIPLAAITLVFRENPKEWGIKFKGSGKEFKIVVIFYLIFLPFLFIFAQTDSFQDKYPKLKLIKDNGQLFFMYQGVYLIKWIAWEFFFRGYLLFGFAKKYGEAAILFSTMPFVIVHLGKPQGEIFGAIAAGFILCRLALNGRSIFPLVWLHFMVAGTMDFMNCTFYR
ncbi:MAG: CPBP family intramembrane glutamic endopeptidase [Myxococcota bacterium]